MTNFRKSFQEEQDKELEELWKFSFENEKGTSPYHNILNFIHSREETLLKRIGEEVEKMKKSILEDCAYTGGGVPKKWIREQGKLYEGYNQALDDIKNIL